MSFDFFVNLKNIEIDKCNNCCFNMEDRNIVFYDGECGFCQSTVQVILKNDHNSLVYFAAIQSDFTNQFFYQLGEESPDLSTFYFYNKGKIYSKSSGALKLVKYLKFPYPFLMIFKIVPKFVRDFVYDLVARNRLKLASNSCRIPTAEEKSRFIS